MCLQSIKVYYFLNDSSNVTKLIQEISQLFFLRKKWRKDATKYFSINRLRSMRMIKNVQEVNAGKKYFSFRLIYGS